MSREISKFSSRDFLFMRRALRLAARGIPFVSSNPVVGAVVSRGKKILAQGWHARFGGPHAEADAIEKARKKKLSLRGSTMYVTLEPCIHENKKTPPCAPEIIKSGIKRVVIAVRDPNPRVNGRAILALKKAGIEVTESCMEEAARKLNEKFFHFMKTGCPFVALKIASSLDGKIATRNRDSKWITSKKSRDFARKLRDSYDAILVGINTVLKDDPGLGGTKRDPMRIILDSYLKIPPKSKVLRNKSVLLVCSARAPKSKINFFRKRGCTVKIFPNRIKITPLLRYLGALDISSIFVEGGSTVAGSFLDSGAVNKAYWFIAPKIVGGRDAVPAISGKGADKIKNALNLHDVKIKRIGDDLFIEASTGP